MKNLSETENLYKCFASAEKLRIWNLLLNVGIIIPADIVRVLKLKKTAISKYLIEFSETGLIRQDAAGKYKLYFIDKQINYLFIKSLIDQCEDSKLNEDIIKYEAMLKGSFLKGGESLFISQYPRRVKSIKNWHFLFDHLKPGN